MACQTLDELHPTVALPLSRRQATIVDHGDDAGEDYSRRALLKLRHET